MLACLLSSTPTPIGSSNFHRQCILFSSHVSQVYAHYLQGPFLESCFSWSHSTYTRLKAEPSSRSWQRELPRDRSVESPLGLFSISPSLTIFYNHHCSIIGFTAIPPLPKTARHWKEYWNIETTKREFIFTGHPLVQVCGNLPRIVVGALTFDEALDLKLRFTFLGSRDIIQRRLSSKASASPASTLSCSICLPSEIEIARLSSRIVPLHSVRLLLVP